MGTNNYENLNELEGLQFIPVNEKKIPQVKNWQTAITKYDLSNCWGVGLVCGTPSGNVEVIDIDQKYSLDGKLFEQYKLAVNAIQPTLLKKLVVQKTKNGGYHFIYRCAKIEGNIKLANRPTTDAERTDTYNKTYEAQVISGKDDAEAIRVAKKAKENDSVRVLLETRGFGGQIVIYPSPGYEVIYGDIYSITEITVEERETLHSIARQFNSVFEEVVIPRNTKIEKTKGLSPFDDYNERGDVVALLQSHGWKVVGNKGNKTLLLRPGQTSAQTSGNYDHEKNWFSVFTTSSEFEPQKAYLPYAVFAKLEANDDFSEAARKLLDMGYGEKKETVVKKEYQSTRVIQSRIKVDDNDLSFLATSEDYDGYIQSVIDGTLKQGLTTGSPTLDQHFRFKEASFLMVNGIDNVGKTKFLWWLELVAAMYHDWKFLIFSSENSIGSCMRALIQYYWGKPLTGKVKLNDTEIAEAKKFIESHFKIIKAQEDLFNYKDIINMTKKARDKYPDLKCCMVDPYNSLKIDLSGFSKLSTHEYHYEALSEMKAYGQQTNFGWIINHHAVTAAARAKDGEKKYPLAPNKADTEGGQKVANKADDFLTIHRVTQHPTDWMVTEVHVRKIKDTETGGKPTPLEQPVKFEMYNQGCSFIERLEDAGQPVDPIHTWHVKRQPVQQEIMETRTDIDWTKPFF
jgi:hypothetical protein